MRYAIYEHPLTHRFAFVPLPHGFVEGEKLPSVSPDRWFPSQEEALAALPTLLDLEDAGQDPSWADVTPTDATAVEDIGQTASLTHEDARCPRLA